MALAVTCSARTRQMASPGTGLPMGGEGGRPDWTCSRWQPRLYSAISVTGSTRPKIVTLR